MPPSPRARSRRRKAALLGLLLLALLAAPFLFTAAIVRHVLASSPYAAFRPTFTSARLNPFGAVTLSGVVLHDTGDHAADVLLTADHLRLSFSWSGLLASRFQSIDIDGATVYARPNRTSPLTLLQLGAPPHPASPAAPAPAANPTAAPQPPFRTLTVQGKLLFGRFGLAAAALGVDTGDALPLTGNVSATPLPAGILWDVSLLLGDPDAPNLTDPVLAARAHITSDANARIFIDSMTLTNLSADFSKQFLAAAHLPPLFSRDIAAHLDRLQLAGTLYLSPALSVDAAVQVHELSAKSVAPDPFSVDRLTFSTRVRGPLTANPLADLTFSRAHCTFDSVSFGQVRLTRADADLSLSPAEIGCTDLEAFLGDSSAELHASAAWDLVNNIPSRADVDLRFLNLATLQARLPASFAPFLPPLTEGHLDARLFITDAEPGRIVAHLDLAAPDRASLDASQLPRAFAPLLPFRDSSPSLSLFNLTGNATLTWSGRFTDVPELTSGHVALGSLSAAAEAIDPQQLCSNLSADFAVVRGFARLDDFSLALPANGKIAAAARYDLARRSLASASLQLSGIDARAFIPWFPQETALAGRLDLSAHYNGLNQPAMLDAHLTGDATLRLPEGTLRLTGNPTLALRATPSLEALRIDAATLKGPATLSASAPLVASFRTLIGDQPASSSGSFLERFKEGAAVSLENLQLAGTITRIRPTFTGTLALTNASAGSVPDAAQPTRVDNLSLAATVTCPLQNSGAVALTGAHLTATRLTLGQNIASALAADFTLAGGTLTAPTLDFAFADGAFHGSVAAGLYPAPVLEQLSLTGRHVSQAAITRNLFPDRFTADGPATLTIDLHRANGALAGGALTGAIDITAEAPGTLKISKDVSQGTFAPAAQAAAQASQSLIPDNFQQIVIDQLANFPYVRGASHVSDTAAGAELHIDEYTRAALKPGDPGYAVPINVLGQPGTVNIPVNLKNLTLRLKDLSVADLLSRAVGLQDFLIRRPPATAPR